MNTNDHCVTWVGYSEKFYGIIYFFICGFVHSSINLFWIMSCVIKGSILKLRLVVFFRRMGK